jgi:N-acetylmuramoyl-L-alanine amidase
MGALIGTGTRVAQASTQSVASPVVILDAGHGGVDAGVIGKTSGVKESDLNLKIVTLLKGYFTGAGFTVILTRKTQAGLYGLPTKGFKMRDMQNRKRTIQNANADLVISIHQNFFSRSSSCGAIVFFNEASQTGKALATDIQTELNQLNASLSTGTKQNVAMRGDYFMLKCTTSPSVIVECGFLSNPTDEQLLISTSYQQQLANAIFLGTITFFSH